MSISSWRLFNLITICKYYYNFISLADTLPVPAGSFNMLHKAATAVANGDSIQSVAIQMGQDELLRRAGSVPGLSTVLGSVLGDTEVHESIPGQPTSTSTPQLSAGEIQILRTIAAEYASEHSIDLDELDEQMALKAKTEIHRSQKSRSSQKNAVKMIAPSQGAQTKRQRRAKSEEPAEDTEAQTVVQPNAPLADDNPRPAKMSKAAKRRANKAAAAKASMEV